MTKLFHSTDINPVLSISLIMLSLLAGCSSTAPVEESQQVLNKTYTPISIDDTEYRQQTQTREESFFTVYNQWHGVPYRLGGNSKRGIDCSGFVQVAYKNAWQLPLPRTTMMQSKIGENISYNSAKYGDLVFFKISKSTKHVGVYLGNSRFMHASTSQGVMISRIDNPYWASKFWQFRRIETQTN